MSNLFCRDAERCGSIKNVEFSEMWDNVAHDEMNGRDFIWYTKENHTDRGKYHKAACANQKYAAFFLWFRTDIYGMMLFGDAKKRYKLLNTVINAYIC